MSSMPVVPVDSMLRVATIEGLNARIIRAAFKGKKGESVCTLRASKPFPKFVADNSEESLFAACANYVWRMLCFSFVASAPHSCFPVTADFDIGSFFYKKHGVTWNDDCNREAYRAEKDGCIKEMDSLIKQFETTVPVTLQAGTMRWGRALGMIR